MPRRTDLGRRLDTMKTTPRFRVSKIDWTKCPAELRALEANRATTLGFAGDDTPIREAFEAFELDSTNPWAWRLLLYNLAQVHFGSDKDKKRTSWSNPRLHELLRRSLSCCPEGSTDKDRIKSLREAYPEDYAHFQEQQLRRKLRDARKAFPDFGP